MRIATLAMAAGSALALAAPAHAGGFYLQEQGVRGTGRAYSGEAADTGVESLWWNPAAIAGSGREAYVGANGILVSGKLSDRGSTIAYPGRAALAVGGEPFAFNPVSKAVVPNFAIAAPVTDRFAVGVSLNAPYNFTNTYRAAAWTRYDALKGRLNTGDLQLTAATRVTDWLDAGVSADAQYVQANLINALPNLAPGLPDGRQQLRGHGWAWGWAAGAEARFGAWTFGASYRSTADHNLKGEARVSGLLGPLAGADGAVPARATFRLPWIATVGARWKVTDRLTLNAQAQRFGWSAFDAIRVTTPAGSQSLGQGYHDSTQGGVGFDYVASPRLTLRAGVQHDQTPTPDTHRTALVPDGSRWLFGIGASAQLPAALTLDAAVSYVAFKNSTVNHDNAFYEGTPAQTTTVLRGTVQAAGYVLAVGLRKGF